MGNLDYAINSKNTLSERYIYSTDPTTAAFRLRHAGSRGTCVPGGPVNFQYCGHAATLKLTSHLTNNLVNEAHVAFQRFGSVSTNLIPFTDTQVGITPLNPAVNMLSQIVISGEFQLGGELCLWIKYRGSAIRGWRPDFLDARKAQLPIRGGV